MSTTSSPSLNKRIAEMATHVPIPQEVLEIVWHSVILSSRERVRGLPIGARAPEFTLRSEKGEIISSKALLEKSPLVLCFLRGDWCLFCMIEVAALREVHARILDLGARLVVIHPQRDNHPHFGGDAPFDICSDDTHEVMAAYDVRFPVSEKVHTTYRDLFGLDLTQINAGGLLNLPVPATFIIDRDGIIKARQFDPDFRVRAEPEYILSALMNLPALSEEFRAEQ